MRIASPRSKSAYASHQRALIVLYRTSTRTRLCSVSAITRNTEITGLRFDMLYRTSTRTRLCSVSAITRNTEITGLRFDNPSFLPLPTYEQRITRPGSLKLRLDESSVTDPSPLYDLITCSSCTYSDDDPTGNSTSRQLRTLNQDEHIPYPDRGSPLLPGHHDIFLAATEQRGGLQGHRPHSQTNES